MKFIEGYTVPLGLDSLMKNNPHNQESEYPRARPWSIGPLDL